MFRVGFPPCTLVLAQVVPGRESEVSSAMVRHFACDDKRNIERCVYFAFSEYDILAIVPLSEESQLDRLTTFGHQHVRDLQQILCFPWVKRLREQVDFNLGPALTVTFCKLDENNLTDEKRGGLHAEYDAIRCLRKRLQDIQRTKSARAASLSWRVLGTLGWPELLLMLSGNNLSVLLEIVQDLTMVPIEPEGEASLSFTFSHTIPCIRRRKNDSERLEAESVGGRVACQVTVDAWPENYDEIRDRVNSLFTNANGSPEHTEPPHPQVPRWHIAAAFGRKDLIITPHNFDPVNVSDIINLLAVLRDPRQKHDAQNRGGEDREVEQDHSQEPLVTASHTHILTPLPIKTTTAAKNPRLVRHFTSGAIGQFLPRVLSSIQSRFVPNYPRIEETGGTSVTGGLDAVLGSIDEFGDWERGLGNPDLAHAGRLRQMLFRYVAIQSRQKLRGIADDMATVLDWATFDALALSASFPLPPVPIVPPDVRKEYTTFYEAANLFFFGLDQRLAGGVFGVSDPARAYTHLHALGIQRILRAAEAIPRSLLRLVRQQGAPLKWPGFVVFGYKDEAATLAYDVLNLPYQYVTTPSEWWRLAHEAGHACVDLQSFAALPGFRAMLQRIASEKIQKPDLIDLIGDPEELLEDLVASIFEFEFAFRRDFERYMRTMWRFFNRRLEGQEQITQLRELLLRTVFVFMYDRELKDNLRAGDIADEIIEMGKSQRTIPEDRSMDRGLSLRALGEYENLEKLIEAAIIRRVVEEAPKLAHGVRAVKVEAIADLYRLCEPWRSWMVYIMHHIGPDEAFEQGLEGKLKKCWSSLDRGKALHNKSDEDLFLIPLALQHQRQRNGSDTSVSAIPLRARIAAILSLWHWDRIHVRAAQVDNHQRAQWLSDI
jgi:hypothetical protein